MGLPHVGAGLGDQREQVVGRNAQLLFEELQTLVHHAGVDAGVLFGFGVFGALERIKGPLDLGQHRAEALEVILVHLQLEIVLREICPQGVFALPESGERPFAVGLAARLEIFLPHFVRRRLGPLRVFDQTGQGLEVGLAAVDFLVDDDPVEAFLAIEEFLAQRDDVAVDDASLEQRLLGMQFGVFDALGNLDLLFPGEQRYLAHLFEVHPHRVVEDVMLGGTRLLFLCLLLPLLVAIHLVGIEDVDLEVLEDGDDVLNVLRVVDALWQRIVDVVEGQVTLLLGQADQVADLLIDAGGAGGQVGADRRDGSRAGRRGRGGHGGGRTGGHGGRRRRNVLGGRKGGRFRGSFVIGRLGFARHGKRGKSNNNRQRRRLAEQSLDLGAAFEQRY